MMKKLLVFLLCVFWSFFAYSMDYKEFLANNDLWYYQKYYSMGDLHDEMIYEKGCEFLGMNQVGDKDYRSFSDSERPAIEAEQMDFWYYCPPSEVKRKQYDECGEKWFENKKWTRKDFEECLSHYSITSNPLSTTSIRQCRVSYEGNFSSDTVPLVKCRFR